MKVLSWQDKLEQDFPNIDFITLPSTGQGWETIIRQACVKLQLLSQTFNVVFIVNQIKEKYGTLRMYVDMRCSEHDLGEYDADIIDDIAQDIVATAETSSRYICEVCGKFGQLYPGGWYIVRCKECYEEYCKQTQGGT